MSDAIDSRASAADAIARGMPECPNCGCVCDPHGPGGVCMCDLACEFCKREQSRELAAMQP